MESSNPRTPEPRNPRTPELRNSGTSEPPSRLPLLLVAGVILATFGLPVARGSSLLPQHVMPSVFPAGLSSEPASATPGALTIDPVGASQVLPWDRLVGDAIRGARLPLWNPYSLSGVPLLANVQSAAFFPLQLLQDLAPPWLWSVTYLLRFGIAAAFTFLFLRRVGLDAVAAASGAVFFALSGPVVLYFRLEPAFNSTVMLPVTLYFAERLHGEWSRPNLVMGSGAFACLVVSGQPEVTALNALFLIAYSAFRTWGQVRDGARLTIAARPVIFYVVGALLSMAFVLPVLEYVARAASERRETFGRIALSPKVAALQIAPYLLGGIHRPVSPAADALFSWNFVGGYVGASAFYLALVAIVSTTKPRLRGLGGFAGVVAAILLLKIYGLPPAQWMAAAPVLEQFFFTRYSGATLSVCVAILVAIGVQAFTDPRDSRARRNAFVVAAAILILLLVPLKGILFVTRASLTPLLLAWLVLGVMGVFAFSRARSVQPMALAVVLASELMILASYVLAPLPRAQPVFADPAFVSFLRARQAEGFGRLYALDGYLYGNYAAAFGLYALNVCEGLIPRNVREFASRYLDPGMDPAFFDGASPFRTSGSAREALRTNRKYYDLIGVRFLVGSPGAAMVESAPRSFPVNRQNVAVGFSPGARATARLRLDRDELSGVKVLMATYGRRNRGSIVLRVRDAAGSELRRSEIPASSLRDNDYAEFRFPSMAVRRWDSLTLEWEYAGGSAGDAVAFWCEPDSRTGDELQGTGRPGDFLPYIIQQSDDGWRQIYDGDARIWENPTVLPRAFVVPRLRVAPSREEALNLMADVDLRQEAVITSADPAAEDEAKASYHDSNVGQSTSTVGRSFSFGSGVTITEMTPTKVSLTVAGGTRGLLVLTDTYYPGWVATVDGAPRPIYETNGAFRGVFLEEGDREVSFEYRPQSFRAGFLLSGAAIVLLALPWRLPRRPSNVAADSRV